MNVLGIAGWDTSPGAHKIEAVLPALRQSGLRVSVLVEAPLDFDLDRPGKDSFEHRKAGAVEVALSSTQRWAIMHEAQESGRPNLAQLVEQMSEVDLLLVLGFEREFRETLEERSGEGWRLLSLPLDAGPEALTALILAARARPAAARRA